MKKIARLFVFSKELDETAQVEFSNKQYYSTLTSLFVFSVLLFSVGLILLFLWNYPYPGPEYYATNRGNLYRNYLYIVLLSTQLLYILYYLLIAPKSAEQITRLSKIVAVGETYFFLCWGAAMSGVDQLIHGDITVYLLACFATAAVIRLYPWQFLIGYVASLLLFLLGITNFQSDPVRLAAHYVNGPILILMAFLTSLVMYRVVMRSFGYRTAIERQKDVMESKVYERTADLARTNEELIAEVAERKAAEEKMRYLSMYDKLTGLYNRTFFEVEMRRMETEYNKIGIIMCDVDGLKLINDSMGHDQGDNLLINTALLIKNCFSSTEVVARVGGDEFAILLPGATQQMLEDNYKQLQEKAVALNKSYHEFPLSLSIGFALRENKDRSLNELYIEADDNMYREKLYRRQSTRSAIVQTLMKALEARDFITEGHAERLQIMVADLGNAMGLSPKNIVDMRLLAQFHDIGKVGLRDRILFKPGPLNDEERLEMQKHSEIGNRIALSSPDLMHIADWVLKHHEWWNGQGYPLGLSGEEIPVQCRILAIADAYDAMTSDRPYRQAMSHAEAMEELKRCAGKQFDPELVEIFTDVLHSDYVGQDI